MMHIYKTCVVLCVLLYSVGALDWSTELLITDSPSGIESSSILSPNTTTSFDPNSRDDVYDDTTEEEATDSAITTEETESSSVSSSILTPVTISTTDSLTSSTISSTDAVTNTPSSKTETDISSTDTSIEVDSTTSTTTKSPHQMHITSRSFSWTATETDTVIVRVDDGYSISVTVSDVNLDGDSGNYLLIKGGDSPVGDGQDGRIFTHSLAKPYKFLYKTNAVYAHYENNGGTVDQFKVVFERVGEITTVTQTEPTTTISWPVTAPEDSVHLLVNVSGEEYDNWRSTGILNSFRTCVKNMAQAYCKDQEIITTAEITETNVLISDLNRCPYSWPDSDKCVQIRFRLPIFYEEGKWTGYQLSTSHLKIMWDRYAQEYLVPEFQVYDEPDVDAIVKWWAIAIIVVTVVFIVLLGILRILGVKFASGFRKRRVSDTVSIVSSRGGRESNISLTPHYLQETPKLFENEYPMVDPMLR